MRLFSKALLAASVAISVVACGQVGNLQGKRAFKEANTLYQQQKYEAAAAKYEEVIKAAPDSAEGTTSYFFLANSYDNLYKPSRKGEAYIGRSQRQSTPSHSR